MSHGLMESAKEAMEPTGGESRRGLKMIASATIAPASSGPVPARLGSSAG